jgi:hypothetical protein
MFIFTSDLMRQTNQVGVRFLIAELDAGLTFVAVAGSATLPGGRDRNLRSAGEVYRVVLRLLPRVQPAPDDKLELRSKMAELRQGLISAGYSPDG